MTFIEYPENMPYSKNNEPVVKCLYISSLIEMEADVLMEKAELLNCKIHTLELRYIRKLKYFNSNGYNKSTEISSKKDPLVPNTLIPEPLQRLNKENKKISRKFCDVVVQLKALRVGTTIVTDVLEQYKIDTYLVEDHLYDIITALEYELEEPRDEKDDGKLVLLEVRLGMAKRIEELYYNLAILPVNT